MGSGEYCKLLQRGQKKKKSLTGQKTGPVATSPNVRSLYGDAARDVNYGGFDKEKFLTPTLHGGYGTMTISSTMAAHSTHMQVKFSALNQKGWGSNSWALKGALKTVRLIFLSSNLQIGIFLGVVRNQPPKFTIF